MKARNLLLMIPLGAALALLPAMASSETMPSVEAVATGGAYGAEPFAWSPMQATVGAGGSVKFSTGSTTAPHGIVWSGGPSTPACSGVPVNSSMTGWSGSCTFTQAGTYTYYCAYHGTGMSGKVVVTAAGMTTTTTTTAPTPPPTPTPTTTTPTPTPKPVTAPHLTRAQKLAKALRACRKKPKGKRAACRKRAHKKYGRSH